MGVFVNGLYGWGLISEERYKKLVRDLEAGPSAVRFAGVELNVNYDGEGVHICYLPRRADALQSHLGAKG